MLDKIKDIKDALSVKAYQSALSMTVTLPAICAEVEYGDSKINHYKEWCDTYIPTDAFHFEYYSFDDNEVNGKVLYQLRCSILHAGTSDIIKKDGVVIDNLSFWVDETQHPTFGYEYRQSEINGVKVISTKIDLIYLINTICDAAENYYNTRQNKADFSNHKIKIEIR